MYDDGRRRAPTDNDLDEPVAEIRLHDAAAARDLGRLEERNAAPAQPHRVHTVRDAHLFARERQVWRIRSASLHQTTT